MALNDIADVLVRQTWQIVAVFGVVWACCAVLRRASAHGRYLLWLLVIIKCLTPPIVNIPIPLLTSRTQVSSQAAAPQTIRTKPTDVDSAVARFQAPARSELPQVQSEPERTIVRTSVEAAPQRFTPGQWLITTWMLVAGTILASVLVRFGATNRRLRRLRAPADDETRNAVAILARTLRATKPPEVYLSPAAEQPFVWGLVRGDIYVPPGFANQGTEEERQAVLLHELAHVARCDAAVNLVQIVVQAIFFFHPLVWWANRRIRHEREKCCDEIVLSDTRNQPEMYCRAIVEILASGSRQARWTPALAVTGSIKNIEDRIVTILTPDRKFYRRPSSVAVATIVLAAACLLPTAIVLTSRPQALAAADPPAQEKTAAPAQEIGGAIRNKSGKPIPNVTVTVHYRTKGGGDNRHIRAKIDKKTVSDAAGRWRLNIRPADASAQDLRIYVQHPDYVSDYLPRGVLPTPVIERPPLKELFDQTAVMVMADGKRIEGQVTAAQTGSPIPGARISLSDANWLEEARATTDEDGRFAIAGINRTGNAPISSNRLALIVQAAGYAPELIEVEKMSGPLTIRLRPAGSIHGKVVDEAGKPLGEARIDTFRWRGYRLRLSVKSAADGTFTITDAPADTVEYFFSKQDYVAAERIGMSPSQKAYSLTLKSVVRIVSSVVDAETGKPLEKFSFLLGVDPDDGSAPDWSYFRKEVVGGKYITNIGQENFKYRVRVEADGYMPGESGVIKLNAPDRGEITLDFKLHTSPRLAGTVEGLDKKPLADAEVYLVRGLMKILDRKVNYVQRSDRESVKTDSTGRFEFSPEVEPFCLVAVHKDGLGVVTEKQFAASLKITIQPWEKHKQFLRINRRPAPGVRVDFPGEDL
jgi:beta-lactamase regulating signal transducer with metallopeptidase domain